LNGNDTSWTGRRFLAFPGFYPPRLSASRDGVAAGDVIENALNDDDAYVDAAGNVGEKLIEETVDGVQSVAGEDAGEGGGTVGLNSGNVKIGEFRIDGVR